jgi:hypothetical protein
LGSRKLVALEVSVGRLDARAVTHRLVVEPPVFLTDFASIRPPQRILPPQNATKTATNGKF